LLNGEIFRPLDWINKGIKEQTQSILSMLEIGWTMDDIKAWFGEIPSNIDFNKHILQILKNIEDKYFAERQEVNRKIHELKIQIKNIVDELPADYNGEDWRTKKVQEYYNKVSEAQKINQFIEQAKALQDHFQAKVDSIKSNGENEKSRVNLKFRSQREDINDIINLSKSKIEKHQLELENFDTKLANDIKSTENNEIALLQKNETEHQEILKKLEEEYREKLADAEIAYTANKNNIEEDAKKCVEVLKKSYEVAKEYAKDNITFQQQKIATKEQELLGLDDLEKAELKAVDEKVTTEIEKEELRVGKAAEYLKKTEPIDIEPLQKEADEVAEMQSYLRQWDMMIQIRDGELAEKQRYSELLTVRIDKARELPSELLKTATMPIGGISVDSDGFIRINGTLIDGLSDGEKLELAMRIAKAQAGELEVICLDRFESLNPAAREKLISEISEDSFQYFITSTESDEFNVEKIGEKLNG
jgi:hypothetical protein